MVKIIWMSDPHFTISGDVIGHDPRKRLSAAINHINEHHTDSSFGIVSGDLVNRGTLADYQGLKTYFDTLKIPFFPMVGNHDDRALLRSTFAIPETCMTDYIQYALPVDEGLIVCLDTQKKGSDAGEFCEERMVWLNNLLAEAADTPVFIFMHHPPMLLGLPMQDTENMENGDEFLDLIERSKNIKHLFIGHVHRPISGTVRGIPFATMRSLLYQAPAPRPEWNWESFKPAKEAPNYGVLCIKNSDVNLQYIQFCDFALGTNVLR